jgi:hypothetical protein
MAKKNTDKKQGYGKLLDAWVPPDGAGDPVGCVATTFTFSPIFFEEECLGRFLQLETHPGEDGPLYLVEREEKLSQVICAAALVDQHHCKGFRSLRWDLLSARLSGSVLHAKVALLHWSNLIRLIVTSANLTADGYRRNQEVYGVINFEPGLAAPVGCLEKYVEFLKEAATYADLGFGQASPAISRWDDFLEQVRTVIQGWGLSELRRRSGEIGVSAVLTGPSKPPAFSQLRDLWPAGSPPENAEILSPFFDSGNGPNLPSKEIWGLLKQRGEAQVTYHLVAEPDEGEETLRIRAPENILEAKPKNRPGLATQIRQLKLEEARPLHAKSLWLNNASWVTYMIGSSNFTSAGLGIAQKPNLEANLLYVVRHDSNRSLLKSLRSSFPPSDEIREDIKLKWDPIQGGEDEASSGAVLLPSEFGHATYSSDENHKQLVELNLNGSPPSGWEILDEGSHQLFYKEHDWMANGSPGKVTLPWTPTRPPSGFFVRWTNSVGEAWWPVNISSSADLPPPEELRDLPLEVLIDILTSARPLHQAMKELLHRKGDGIGGGGYDPSIDPHKRVDTSTFLLQRTRRISRALAALRERFERPIPTGTTLEWRLNGPVGVRAIAGAILKEGKSEEEKVFLMTELALELSRVEPIKAVGSLPSTTVKEAIRKVIEELEGEVNGRAMEEMPNLKVYVKESFQEALG